ncbi:MAG: hypothetical protein ACFFFC_07670 [Candidatus Thorarchaeota archaeon]
MIEVLVLLSIIITTIFLAGITVAFGSKNRHSGRTDHYRGSISSRKEDK